MVASPGWSKTIAGLRRSPRASQKARPNWRAPFAQAANASGSSMSGRRPQWSKSLRLITPFAPSWRQNSYFDSSETTATGTPPDSRTIWIAMQPRPPAPPQTSTGSPSRTTFGGQPRSIRQAVAPTSM